MNTTLTLAAQVAGQGNLMPMIIAMVTIFATMWFFMIRPQQKKQREIHVFQNALSAGDFVVTGGGIYGIVKHIDMATNKVGVEIARGVVITADKDYVFANVQASQQGQSK